MAQTSGFPALKSRDFRLFLAGQMISLTGTWMQSTAQGWLVYDLTRSPLMLGLVSAASTLPIMIFSLIGGAVADRVNKRRVVLWTQVLSMIPAFTIGALVAFGAVKVWHIAALVFLLGTINAFDIPARQSFVFSMVGREGLMSAIALNSAVFNGSRITGPVIAGFLIAWLGSAACFFVNGLSYLAAVAALSMVSSRGEPEPNPGPRHMLADIAEGMRFLKGNAVLFRHILLLGGFSLLGLPFISQMPVFAEEIHASGAMGLGLLMGASGVGAFAAAIYIAYKGEGGHSRIKVMNTAALAFPALVIAFTASNSFWLSMGLMFLIGLSLVGFLTTANSSLQLGSPDALRGRVMSVYTLVFLGVAPVGQAVLGLLAGALGSVDAVRITSALCIIVSFIVMPRESKT